MCIPCYYELDQNHQSELRHHMSRVDIIDSRSEQVKNTFASTENTKFNVESCC